MKFITAVLMTTLLSYVGALFLPWWIIAVAGFLVGFVVLQHPFKAFFSGFLAGFLVWGIHAFIIDQGNDHVLATRVAGVFSLNGSFMMIIVTALVGAIVAGLSALSASFLKAKIAAWR
ncbi:MAG: hypothetical protein ABW174_13585 [Flavitalea sp.]